MIEKFSYLQVCLLANLSHYLQSFCKYLNLIKVVSHSVLKATILVICCVKPGANLSIIPSTFTSGLGGIG